MRWNLLGLNLTPCLRSLKLIDSILGRLGTGGSKALEAKTIHDFYVGIWQAGDSCEAI